MPNWKKVITSGSDAVLNSLNTTNGITGSLLGTATTASSVTPLNQNVTITGSLTVISGSNVELQVLNTGVRLGNVSTDAHTVTGSFNVSGSSLFNGNVIISGSSSPGLLVRGSGSATIATFQGSDGAYRAFFGNAQHVMNVTSGGTFSIRPNEGTTNNPGFDFVPSTFGGVSYIEFAGLRYRIGHTGANNANGGLLFQGRATLTSLNSPRFSFDVNGTSITTTSGTSTGISYVDTFAAAAGSASYRPLSLVYTINNSGAQTGTTTGIFLNATQTALNSMTHNLMDLQVGGSSRFRVNNAGNTIITGSLTVRGSGATSATNALYIENSSATAALTVRDDGLVSVMPNNANITIDGSTSSGGRIIIQSPSSNALIGINSYNTFLYPTKLVLFARSTIEGSTNVLGDLRFYNLTTGKTYMFMTETGLTSINKGTVTPNANLDVSGSVIITGSISNSLRVKGSGATSATTTLRIENSNAVASLLVFDNQTVGINKTTTNATLDVSGSASITGSFSVKGTISLGNTTTSNAVIQRAQTPAGSYSTIFAAGTGISDTYPWTRADTDGASVELRAGDPTSDQYSGGIIITANGNTSPLGEGNTIIFKNRTGVATYTERMRITYDGNVGINISPSAKLHIDGTVRIDNQNSSTPTGPNVSAGTVSNYWGTADGIFLSTPNTWLKINLGGADYYLPAYT
jgi:hypothetical protein